MANGAPGAFRDLILGCAGEEGFPLAGTVDIDRARDWMAEHVRRYDEWLRAGFAGEMEYLVRGRDRRTDPRLVMPEAQSVLCVGLPYYRKAAGADTSAEGPRYARYLQGPDYHVDIKDRLERLMRNAEHRSQTKLGWKVCVDTSAVLERSWAAACGLGWIGKNTLLIHPKQGSYFFIGVVLMDRETGADPSPVDNYCGNCRRCLDACPTGALGRRSGQLDSNACISYWTLEKRTSVKPDRAMGTWVAGCDICQEVCPFNAKPARALQEEPPKNVTRIRHWRELLSETAEQYALRVKDTALSRIKPAQFDRNLALALLNAIDGKDEAEAWRSLRPLVQARRQNADLWNRCLDLLSQVPREKREPGIT